MVHDVASLVMKSGSRAIIHQEVSLNVAFLRFTCDAIDYVEEFAAIADPEVPDDLPVLVACVASIADWPVIDSRNESF